MPTTAAASSFAFPLPSSASTSSSNNKAKPRPPPLSSLPLNPAGLAYAAADDASTAPPLSPAVVLSPSTPDFPAGQLALPDVHELLVPARELPRSMTPPLLRLDGGHKGTAAGRSADAEGNVLEQEEGEGDRHEDEAQGASRVRHSLMLLDSKLAEIKSLGFGAVVEEQAQASHTPLPGDLSMHSLASFATNTTTTSSEDAFDIADFPSVDPLDSGYEIDPSSIPRPRRSSSTVMAFPVPPALASAPSTARPSRSASADDEHVFEQLAQLGQRASVQGLGLFSGEGEGGEPTLAPGEMGGRSSRSSSLSESSTLSDKSFGASTLASSAANTSCGPRDVDEFPPDLPHPSQAASWFATSPPTATPRALPSPIDPILANIGGSAHPALASPFAAAEFSSRSGASSPALTGLSRRPSPTATQYSARSSSLPSRRSRSRASSRGAAPSPSPQDEVAPWSLSPAAPITESTFVTSPESHSHELEILADEQPAPVPPRKDSAAVGPAAAEDRSPKVPPSHASSFGKTLRRLSSFGILKKRKSEAVLRDSAGSGNTGSSPVIGDQQQQPRVPLLSKRKSEAALSALLLRSSQRGGDKENSAARRPASPHPPQPPKLARRSVSTPRLAAKFTASAPSPRGEAARPPMPASPASFAGLTSPHAPFAGRQRTSSFTEGDQLGTGKLKKRLSTFFNTGGRATPDETVPPVPPTPKEHLAASSSAKRAPAPNDIDIARANALVIKEVSEPSSAGTLDAISPAHPSSVFSEALPSSSTPATSIFATPSYPAFAVVDVKDEPFHVPMPTSSLSAPAHQQGFMFPPMPSLPDGHDPRLSLCGFMRTADEPLDIPSSKSPVSSAVFPSTRLAQERSSARQRAGEGRSLSTVALEQALPWDRPASPMTFAPQDIIAFPMRLQPELQRALPTPAPLSTSPSTLHSTSAASDEEEDDDESEDEYGSNTASSDEDDKPLGVVVPGALTAQKSLRLTAAKKSRSERKAREAQDPARREQGKGQQARRRREDPFELEHAAAMVTTPPTSHDGHVVRSSSRNQAFPPRHVRPPLSPINSASTVATIQSAGHDALLPHSDASLERRSDALRRSPSTPLDPMVADSALTIDSPEVAQQPLPRPARSPFTLPSPKAESRPRSRSRSRKPDGLSVATSAAPFSAAAGDVPLRSPIALGAPPKPTFRPPPVPTTSSSSVQQAVPAFDRRPSFAARKSSSPTTSPAGTPALSRRPSLHPDLHPGAAMQRQASSSSAVSSAATVSRSGTLSAASGRSRSGTMSSAHPPPPAAVETRVYVDATCEQFVRVNVTDKTLAGEVVAFAKAKGALARDTPGAAEGGWALWEAWRTMGIERPVREYELVADVTRSWDQEGNALFFRRTTMWPILSAHARSHPLAPKTGAIQLEIKKGKWSKRFLTLKDGTLSYSKADKGKDTTTLCQLSNFDVFLVSAEQATRLKAPRPFVFALKSRLTRAHFEETAEWCHFVATKVPEEAASWVKSITEAGNSFARIREQAVLGTGSPATPTSSAFPAVSLLASAGFTPTDAPPVPVVPTNVAAPRNPTSRPMPPALVQRSYTAPLPPVGAPGASLSRAGTVVKPDARQWGAMDHDERQEWLVASERAAKQAKQPLLDLSR
ncbi:uncharacterized protein RHOBADRAFT_51016 [Rhodotorula graminis WP1]|uniref:PH domain-containing protein n=1 Tax=Rhodotorula graminis (strain WP1) TaxID=578459 RepID=A0A194SD99_RHOGW|nr:uncharacterized protein RHOBADRAFT_51016 [Rhodotorula graminis WP1]KPV78562.1 hypothetical protein RHOBADRAFT_51016 [Rhodotorula graminis WP1]